MAGPHPILLVSTRPHSPRVRVPVCVRVRVCVGGGQAVAYGVLGWMSSRFREMPYARVLAFVKRVVEVHPLLRLTAFNLLQSAFVSAAEVRRLCPVCACVRERERVCMCACVRACECRITTPPPKRTSVWGPPP